MYGLPACGLGLGPAGRGLDGIMPGMCNVPHLPFFPAAAACPPHCLQKFDASGFENGVFLGPVASLTFKGPFMMTGVSHHESPRATTTSGQVAAFQAELMQPMARACVGAALAAASRRHAHAARGSAGSRAIHPWRSEPLIDWPVCAPATRACVCVCAPGAAQHVL